MAKKILVIDDVKGLRVVLSSILEKEGYEVVAGENGAELDKLFDSEKPDLVFLDILLPDMDNEDILARVRKLSKKVPVVMCSGYDNTEFAVKTLKEGAFDYVSKPFKNEDIIEVTKRAFQEKEKEKEEKIKKEKVEISEPSEQTKKKFSPFAAIGGVLVVGIIIGLVMMFTGGGGKGIRTYSITYSNPTSITYDGDNLWISDWYGQTVYKHNLDKNLSIQKYYRLSEIHPVSVAWGGYTLWTADSWTSRLNRHNIGKDEMPVRKSYRYPGTDPTGMYFDGDYLWVCDAGEDMIYKFSVQGDEINTEEVYTSRGPNPVGIFSDGKKIWTVDGDLKRVYEHNMDTDLSVKNIYEFPGDSVRGIDIAGTGWDGENIWIAVDKKPRIIKVSMEK
ncbi:MAG: response regulator, partial [Elusimicrobiota bacterium]